MGLVMIAIIEKVAEILKPEPQQWWQIFAIVGGTIATLLTAIAGSVILIKRKKK